MRKLTLLTGALLVLTLAMVGGLSSPKAAWAVICWCDSDGFFFWTPPNSGQGTSCTAAHTDLVAETAADAREDCGGNSNTCYGILHVTTPCYSIGGGLYQEDGYREYNCKVCN